MSSRDVILGLLASLSGGKTKAGLGSGKEIWIGQGSCRWGEESLSLLMTSKSSSHS
jgi:hypothetical protein